MTTGSEGKGLSRAWPASTSVKRDVRLGLTFPATKRRLVQHVPNRRRLMTATASLHPTPDTQGRSRLWSVFWLQGVIPSNILWAVALWALANQRTTLLLGVLPCCCLYRLDHPGGLAGGAHRAQPQPGCGGARVDRRLGAEHRAGDLLPDPAAGGSIELNGLAATVEGGEAADLTVMDGVDHQLQRARGFVAVGCEPPLPSSAATNTRSQSMPVVVDSVASAWKLGTSAGSLSTHSTGDRVPPSRRSCRSRWSPVGDSGSSARTNTNSRRCGSACSPAACSSCWNRSSS